MEYKEILYIISFTIGLIGVFVKNENRITKIETSMSGTLNELVKMVDELKNQKQDRETMKLELENINQKIEYVNMSLSELKILLKNK